MRFHLMFTNWQKLVSNNMSCCKARQELRIFVDITSVVNPYTDFGEPRGNTQKLKLCASNSSAALLMDVYASEILYICSGHMYKNALCSTVPNSEKLKSPIYPSMRRWLQIFWYINTMQQHTPGKTNVST